MRRRLMLVLTAAAVFGVSTGALAEPKFDSKVTISYDPGKRVSNFYGKVKSSEDACVTSRKVVLYSEHGNGDTTKVGSYVTTDNGVWAVEVSASEPVYFAKVKPRDVVGGFCKGDRSKTLHM